MSDRYEGGDSGRLGAGAEVPWFRVWTVASTRRDHRIGALTSGEFERELAEVAWFAHLGEPSPWDDGYVRISGWEQWPGPETALVEAFALAFQDLRDGISRPARRLPLVVCRCCSIGCARRW